MSRILCITNRKLCRDDFLKRISEIAASDATAIVLREKDLDEAEYMELARAVNDICICQNKTLIIHNFPRAAAELGIKAFHGPLHVIAEMTEQERSLFRILGASCHSVEEARLAYELGCTYITAGHVFETDCKKGLPGRGTDLIKAVSCAVPIPVYGLGGISSENAASVIDAGASGVAVMSGLMTCSDVNEYLSSYDI